MNLRPECPSCGSRAAKCKRPSGHDAAEWHMPREDAYARECGCDECCQPWLEKRGIYA